MALLLQDGYGFAVKGDEDFGAGATTFVSDYAVGEVADDG